MKTVICLSFIVLNIFFANVCQGRNFRGGKRGQRPLNKNSPQTAQHAHPNFPYPCSSFKLVAFFGNQQRPWRKVDQIGAMTFFVWISTENLVKTRPIQKFWPLQKQIIPPLEQRSNCGTNMCIKKNCASPTRSLTALHCCDHSLKI